MTGTDDTRSVGLGLRAPDSMILCTGCQRELMEQSIAASISADIMGDEYTESYYLCPSCILYTLVVSRDRFDGDGQLSENVCGPLTKEKGDEKVALIRSCDTSYDKKCRCDAHRTYFKGCLD